VKASEARKSVFSVRRFRLPANCFLAFSNSSGREGRGAELFGDEPDDECSVFLQGLGVYGHNLGVHAERDGGADGFQFLGDGELVLLGGALVEKHAGERGHGGVALAGESVARWERGTDRYDTSAPVG